MVFKRSGADVALYEFENDVKMYGIQTYLFPVLPFHRLRMM